MTQEPTSTPDPARAPQQRRRGRGRPATSSNFTIVPVPHQTPDARKLGRAFIALALHRAAIDAAQVEQAEEAGDESA
jgi:hypothetical protein